jgi:1-deoxy-D-xylulose-5-phosphate synthase
MPVLNLGLPDYFVEQGTREECLTECGLDSQGILASVEAFCA